MAVIGRQTSYIEHNMESALFEAGYAMGVTGMDPDTATVDERTMVRLVWRLISVVANGNYDRDEADKMIRYNVGLIAGMLVRGERGVGYGSK